MKKFFVLAGATLLSVVALAYNNTGDVNEKVLQSFRAGFPHAESVTWEELPKNYVVNFTDDMVRTKIIYQKNGDFVSSVRYYTERTLPSYLRLLVKEEYPGKEIFGITEIAAVTDENNHVETVYYIKLTDAKHWINIRMDSNGDITEQGRYKKAL
jgi:hypothetical protein